MISQTMMSDFSLHPRLASDCHELTTLKLSTLLLLDNAFYKWFILVPQVDVEQVHLLAAEERETLLSEVQQVSEMVEALYVPQRVNVGAIGNLVPQLHYHVIGRFESDPAWPGVVWGHPKKKAFTAEQVAEIKATVLASL